MNNLYNNLELIPNTYDGISKVLDDKSIYIVIYHLPALGFDDDNELTHCYETILMTVDDFIKKHRKLFYDNFGKILDDRDILTETLARYSAQIFKGEYYGNLGRNR